MQDHKPGNEKHDAVRRELDVGAEGKSRERTCRDHHAPNQPDQDVDRSLAEVGPTHTAQIAHTLVLDDPGYFFNTLAKNWNISWVGRSSASPRSLLIVVWFFPSAG